MSVHIIHNVELSAVGVLQAEFSRAFFLQTVLDTSSPRFDLIGTFESGNLLRATGIDSILLRTIVIHRYLTIQVLLFKEMLAVPDYDGSLSSFGVGLQAF